MPLISRSIRDLRAHTAGLLSSKDARFRLAVTCGFVVSAVGVLSVGVGDRPGFAQEWGGMGGLFGGGSFFGQPEQQQPLTVRREPTYHSRRAQRASLYDHVARHRANRSSSYVLAHLPARDARPARVAKPVHIAKADARPDEVRGGPISLSRISMCVRSCDGFAFPIGAYHGEQDREAHDATCQSECPGAQTSLYVLPAGSETMGEAINLRSGQAYSALPQAFHYTTVLSDSCSCHAKSGSRIASLLHDYTLRRGDAVMTGHGLQVFHGGSHFPFKPKDFVALSKSRDIRDNDRAAFHAIERASLNASEIASTDPAKPAHQASR